MTHTADLYANHLATLTQHTAKALEASGKKRALIAAGALVYRFMDDMPYPFYVTPHFAWWLPIAQAECCWLAIEPGKKPQLAYYQPDDFWHVVPKDPQGYWVDQFDIHVIRQPGEAADVLGSGDDAAIIAPPGADIPGYTANNPQAFLDYIDYHRAFKTPYELTMMREASRKAVRGHIAAEQAFRAGKSEMAIHRDYLAATGHGDNNLPYGTIIALNEHGAILHYHHHDVDAPNPSRSFLIDAGAAHHTYGADITRTYSMHDDAFQALIDDMDVLERDLCARAKPGVDYRDLHVDTHRGIADIMVKHDLVTCSAEQAVDTGITRTFFPHGLGHLIGLQTHDVAGFAASPQGGTIDKPKNHPFLRLTRTLEEHMTLTIEPGLYFIPSLLDKLKATPEAQHVHWANVEAMMPYGGIRIEDNIVVNSNGTENMTRDAFGALLG